MNSENIWSVSELTNQIKSLLDGERSLKRVYVRGELSNYKIHSTGHHYFTMKDEEATLKAVMFRQEASRLRFRPETGMKVIALGRISVYPRDGLYQLYVTELVPDGVGELNAAFEQLKAKLAAEGLFDRSNRPHKKPIPKYPRRIAVISSSDGFGLRDVIRISAVRFPVTKLIVMPVRVQGTEAPAEIASAIRYANKWKVADLIITGRGGGSMEELWAFNDERVARAIYASEIPVITAVGHEPDVTIADYVADLRASTPTNAAELAVPDNKELLASLLATRKHMLTAVLAKVNTGQERLRQLRQRRVMTDPGAYLADRKLALDHASELLAASYRGIMADKRSRLGRGAAKLDAMSPLKVLSRGYAIAQTEEGRILRSRNDASPGQRLRLQLADGDLNCRVTEDKESEVRNDG